MKESFQFEKTSIIGLQTIHPFYAEDNRGFFLKAFEKNIFNAHGIDTKGFELFYSRSAKGVVRGLHFQRRRSQDRLVHVLYGAVFDVAVDLRKDSATFGKWKSFYLTADNRQMLYIPKGFAHGFLALEDHTLLGYLCGDEFDPDTDGGIIWNDPQLNIHWPLEQVHNVILSEKDAALPSLAGFLEQYGALFGETAK